jgi:hypothetical protein
MDSGFVEGFGYAIAWLKKWHGLGTEIEELYRHTGIPLADFEKYCDEYDLPSIREVAGGGNTGKANRTTTNMPSATKPQTKG